MVVVSGPSPPLWYPWQQTGHSSATTQTSAAMCSPSGTLCSACEWASPYAYLSICLPLQRLCCLTQLVACTCCAPTLGLCPMLHCLLDRLQLTDRFTVDSCRGHTSTDDVPVSFFPRTTGRHVLVTPSLPQRPQQAPRVCHVCRNFMRLAHDICYCRRSSMRRMLVAVDASGRVVIMAASSGHMMMVQHITVRPPLAVNINSE